MKFPSFARTSRIAGEVIRFYTYLLTLLLLEKPKTPSQHLSLSLRSKWKAHCKTGIPNVTIHSYNPEAANVALLASKLIILKHFSFKNHVVASESSNQNLI